MTDSQMSGTQAQTVVGLFDSFSQAQAVARNLESEGFSQSDISVVANDAKGEYASQIGADGSDASSTVGATTSGVGKGAAIGGAAGLLLGLAALAIPGIGPIVAMGPLATALTGAGIGAVAGGLMGALTNMGVPEEDATYYTEGVKNGGALVMVKATGERAHRAAAILEGAGAENVEEGRDAMPGKTVASRETLAGTALPAKGRDVRTSDREVALPVIEEELAVGKRTVSKGGVRVFSHVTEKPVEKDIELREEHVHVERRPVDRAASEADFAGFKEGTIEVRETAEEGVISKTQRVVEEVVVGKDVSSRTQRVSDTVKRTDVEVEQLSPNDARTTRTRAAGAGTTFDENSPGYLYGTSLASDQRYRGKQWNEIESDVRRDWESRGTGTWESVKESARQAWDKVTGTR